MSELDDLLAVVAAWALPGAPPWPDPEPMADVGWASLVAACRVHRLEGRLVAAAGPGGIPVAPGQREEAEAAHRAAMHLAVQLELELLEVADLLEGAGVEHRVLKGPANAHLDEVDPALRCFGDIDLLVRGDDFDRAAAALVAAGCQRRFVDPRPGFTGRFGKGSAFATPHGLEVDLHRTWVMGPFGLSIDLADLWETSAPFEIAGRRLLALDAENRFLHACFHTALGDREPRWSAMRDVAGIALRPDPPIDLGVVRDRAARWRAEAVLVRGLLETWARLGLELEHPLLPWARDRRPTGRERRALDTYLDPDLGYGARSLAAVGAIPRWSDRVDFVAALVAPREGYRQGRYRSGWARLRAGLAEALRWGRRSLRRSPVR